MQIGFLFIFVHYRIFMARDISAYIRELLFSHDCVIIPGFGAFIGNYFHARVDRKEGLFYPPARRITFNRHLTGNDGLLIGHISSHQGIGYAEARDIVSAWTDDLRGRILAGNNVMLEHLGTFTLNHEGVIIFEPDLTVNYLLSSYGLNSYQRHPVTDYDVRKKVLQHHHQPAVSQPSVKKLLTRAAVIIPVLVALALVPFNDHLFKSRMEESTLNPLARAELEYNREQIKADSAPAVIENTETAAPVTEKKIPEAPAVQARESSVTREVIKPGSRAVVVEDYRYLLIIGSFRGEDNALVMVDKLRRKGYDPEVAAGPDGFLRVSAISYGTLDEAKAVLPKLLAEYPGTWIFKSR
jgi:nucleoid DNA-binding protein